METSNQFSTRLSRKHRRSYAARQILLTLPQRRRAALTLIFKKVLPRLPGSIQAGLGEDFLSVVEVIIKHIVRPILQGHVRRTAALIAAKMACAHVER